MSVSVDDLHELAGELSKGESEVKHRNAICRAYYAAYHACNIWHSALPAMGRNAGFAGGIHQTLVNRLKNPDPAIGESSARLSRTIGTQLDVLRGSRKIADYDLDNPSVDSAAAQNACVLSRTIIDKTK